MLKSQKACKMLPRNIMVILVFTIKSPTGFGSLRKYPSCVCDPQKFHLLILIESMVTANAHSGGLLLRGLWAKIFTGLEMVLLRLWIVLHLIGPRP